ncbi:uncharacterized protein LOC105066330 [Camelus bactrianus]|uniref:Uncharacterized protein LOC105066330 n=1 Tax=Camelus bactrianus TaxID=9837 RepID=A0AC58RJP2_CAMBA
MLHCKVQQGDEEHEAFNEVNYPSPGRPGAGRPLRGQRSPASSRLPEGPPRPCPERAAPPAGPAAGGRARRGPDASVRGRGTEGPPGDTEKEETRHAYGGRRRGGSRRPARRAPGTGPALRGSRVPGAGQLPRKEPVSERARGWWPDWAASPGSGSEDPSRSVVWGFGRSPLEPVGVWTEFCSRPAPGHEEGRRPRPSLTEGWKLDLVPKGCIWNRPGGERSAVSAPLLQRPRPLGGLRLLLGALPIDLPENSIGSNSSFTPTLHSNQNAGMTPIKGQLEILVWSYWGLNPGPHAC